MRQIQAGIEENMLSIGTNDSRGRFWHTQRELGRREEDTTLLLRESIRRKIAQDTPDGIKRQAKNYLDIPEQKSEVLLPAAQKSNTVGSGIPDKFKAKSLPGGLHMQREVKWQEHTTGRFVPAGQSTQMIIGATGESDYQILSVSEALYRKFDLKRVFYSAFIRVNDDSHLPVLPGGPPLRREHRLYQADWLLRYYGFESNELLSESQPNFNEFLDPKCDWAIRHFDHFPVEINQADYYTLLRVPGIGVRSARRIVKARQSGVLDFPDLKKIGVVLKRAIYFITCKGKSYYSMHLSEGMVLNNLLLSEPPVVTDDMQFQQLSFFDGSYEELLGLSNERINKNNGMRRVV